MYAHCQIIRNQQPKKPGWAKREDTPTDGEKNAVVKEVLLQFSDVMTTLAQFQNMQSAALRNVTLVLEPFGGRSRRQEAEIREYQRVEEVRSQPAIVKLLSKLWCTGPNSSEF